MCVKAKIKEDAHHREQDKPADDKDGLRTISMDYQEYDAEKGTGIKNVKTIVIKDAVSGAVASFKVTCKGPGDDWVLRRIKELRSGGEFAPSSRQTESRQR